MAFPTNPTDGQLYNENGITYLYVSPPGAWTRAGGVPITIDETDPVFTNSAAVTYTEAPSDGTPYSRQDGGWVAASATINSINDISDVDTTGVVGGDVLKWNGAAWTPTTDDDTDTLAALTDTNIPSPTLGDVLSYNGAVWSSVAPFGASGVDLHLNTSTATTDQVLSWDGADYAWVDAGSGGGGSTGPFPEILLKGDVSITQDDSTNGYTFTTTNTPTLDTGDKQFGAGSMSFPANAKITTNETVNFGTSPFCIEAWLKPTSVSGVVYWGSKPAIGQNCWLQLNSGVPGIYYAGAPRSATSSLSTSAWNHVAFVFDGTNLKVYFNGTEESTAVASTDIGDFVWAFGGTDGSVAGAGNWYDGKIDDLRVTIGDPVYTANFTPAEHPIPVANPLGAAESDVTISSPTNGEVLTYSGNKWVNAASPSVWEDQTTYYRAEQHIVVGSATQTPDYVNSSFPGITISGSTGASVNFLSGGGALQGRIFGQNNGIRIRPATSGFIELTNPSGQEVLSVNYVADKVTIGGQGTTGFTLPNTDGTANQVLQTDGAGTVSWATAGGGGLSTTATSPVATTNTLETLTTNDSMATKGVGSGFFVGVTNDDNTSFATSYRLFGQTAVSLPYYGGLAHYSSAQNIVAGRNACGLSIDGASAGLNSSTTGFVVHDNLTTPKFKVNYNTGATDVNGDLTVTGSVVKLTNLPTSDPVVAGQLWNDAGTLKISAG